MKIDTKYFQKVETIDRALQKNTVDSVVFDLIKKESIANYFFDQLTKSVVRSELWFKDLIKRGYFDPSNNPKPRLIKEKNSYQIPLWNVLPYLEKVAEKTRALDTELVRIIQDVSLYKDKEGNYTDNYRTWSSFTKILGYIPLSTVPKEFFTKALPVWFTSQFDFTLPGADLLNDLLPTYLNQIETPEHREKVEEMVIAMLALKPLKKVTNALGEQIEIETIIDSYWLEESLIENNNAATIAQKCTNRPILTLAKQIKDLFEEKFESAEDYSYIWFSNLNHDSKINSHDGEKTLTVILRKLALEKVQHNSAEGEKILKIFLSDDFPHYIFKRLALVLINTYWDSYPQYLDIILKTHPEYLNISSFQGELSMLLKNNSEKLNEQQKTTIGNIIERGPERYIPKNNVEMYINKWKQGWYKALYAIPEFKEKYEAIKKITKIDIAVEEREEITAFKESERPQKVIPIEEILEKTNKEIVEIINKFSLDASDSMDSIYRDLENAIQIKPAKFTNNLRPFKVKNYALLSRLYRGITESWKKKDIPWVTQKETMWIDIATFTLELLSDEIIWKTSKKVRKHHNSDYKWVVYEIATLIQEGCRTDSWAFPETLHPNIEEILIFLLKRSQREATDYEEPIHHAANSAHGKALEALIYLGLREARLSDKKQEKKQSKWSSRLQKAFDKALTDKRPEAYTLLGQYMHNIHYIDSPWTLGHAEKIYKLVENKIFKSFIAGYVFSGQVHEKLYRTLSLTYKRALALPSLEKYTHERLLQHIAVGYMRGYDNIGHDTFIESLFKQSPKQIAENIHDLAEFFWHQREYLVDSASDMKESEKEIGKNKILQFWEYTTTYFKEIKRFTTADKKALSELSKLMVYLDTLDKEYYDILSLSAPYVTDDFNGPYFLEYLNGLIKKTNNKEVAFYTGTLFYEMLKNNKGVPPDYEWEDIKNIITLLFKTGKEHPEIKQLANQICIYYADKFHNYGLKSLYEANNSGRS